MSKLRQIIFVVFLLPCLVQAQVKEINLNSAKWEFSEAGTDKWYPATIPGCVYTDLLANHLIPDPYYGGNERAVQWVESKNWDYRTSFVVDPSVLKQDRITLNFEGLDTYANVYVNGALLLHADNMFRRWEVDCKAQLKAGKNQLLISFISASETAKAAYQKLAVPLPYDERVMVRKAQYQFGWDWGPRLVTAGIWKPVTLKAWNGARFKYVWHTQKSIITEKAELLFHANIESEKEINASFRLTNNDGIVQDIKVQLHSGINNIDIPYSISNPELWWPNGFGKQKLYSFGLQLSVNSKTIDSTGLKIGLRTIELVQNNDSIGKSFYFKVNGVPVFMKGANYIPQDNFPSRVTHEQYGRLINDAADCGMNMLRVWGGGIYECDHFYDLCDEKGLLVWQDFMFACAMYPGDTAFLNNVSKEVIDNVNRLKNHPCIALWCGNNEIDEGWNNWGMQKQFKYTLADSSRIWRDYLALFRDSIPFILKRLDAERPYVPSSPIHGWGRKESMTEGDSHYWGVWWGDEPFETYNKKVPRFMSEYGFQGFPDLKTLDNYLKPEDRVLTSEKLKNHEKHPRGFELIRSAMLRDYWVPDDFRKFALLSQFVQASAIRTAIEAQRRAMPRCMGSLYWQLNDCWPVISWSGIDYSGQWKAAQYEVKRDYSPLILSPVIENNIFRIYAISDYSEPVDAKMELDVMDNQGKILNSSVSEFKFLPERSKVIYETPAKNFLNVYDTTKDFIFIRFCTESLCPPEATFFLCKPQNYQAYHANIKTEFTQIDSLRWRIELSTDVPVPGAYLQSDEAGIHFPDNFFDLIPERPKSIIVSLKHPVPDIDRKLRVGKLYDLR